MTKTKISLLLARSSLPPAHINKHVNLYHECSLWSDYKGIVQNMDWTGLDSWTGQLDWTIGLDSWTGQLDWTVGLDYWTGILFLLNRRNSVFLRKVK